LTLKKIVSFHFILKSIMVHGRHSILR
jgi:hypothetical protein